MVAVLIIGELLNSTRRGVREALRRRDEGVIRRLARAQVEAGAAVLDVNAAASVDRELEDLEWMIRVVQAELGEGVRLAIDSPNPEAIELGLSLCQGGPGPRPMINSINNDPKLQERLIPLAKEFDAEVIALAMGPGRLPKTAEERLREAERLLEALEAAGIEPERVYIDPLVMAIGTDQEQGRAVLEAVRGIKERWGALGVKTCVGLSNVSFGLPRRSLINRAFLAMLLAAGLDAALLDPTDRELMDTLRASEALVGLDPYCLRYIKHMRA